MLPTFPSAPPIIPPTALNGEAIFVSMVAPNPPSFPVMAPSGPVIPESSFVPMVLPIFPIGARIELNIFPNDFPTPPRALPTLEKYPVIPFPAALSLLPRPTPAALASAAFAPKMANTVFTPNTLVLISRKPSLPTRLATFNPASAPATFKTVCTSLGFACANSETFVTTPASLSAIVPTIGNRFCPRTIPRFAMLFFAFAIFSSVLAATVSNAACVAPALSTIP